MLSNICNRMFSGAGTRRIARLIIGNLFFLILVTLLLLPVVGWVTGTNIEKYLSTFTLFGSEYSLFLPFEIIGGLALVVTGVFFVILERRHCRMLDESAADPSDKKETSGTIFQKISHAVTKRCRFVLLVLMLAGAFLFYHRGISASDFSNDEFQVVSTAYGYLQTGHFNKWDFCNEKLSKREYLRAFPHTWLVARAISLLGKNEWSTRLVSVLFGVLSVLIGYFVAEHFLKNRLFSFLLAAGLIFHPNLSELFKITRMYSMLLPFFLVLFFCTHKLILLVDSDGIAAFKRMKNLLLLIGTVLLTGFTALIHVNALTILPYIFCFVLIMAAVTRKRAFLRLGALGTAACLLVWGVSMQCGLLKIFTNHMSAFGSFNYRYVIDLLKFPFGFPVGTGCALLSILILPFLKNRRARISILSLISAAAVGAIFFVFIAKRYYAVKYISFLIPVSMIWSVFSFYLIFRLFSSRWKRVLLFTAALSGAAMPLLQMKPLKKGIDYKTAYRTISENYDAEKKEIIAAQFLRCYYLGGIGNKADIYDLKRRQTVTYKDFMDKITTTSSGWVTWATKKRGHVDLKIQKFANRCFKKHHGTGVDKTGVEVFYYDQDMPCLRRNRRLPEQVRYLVDNAKETSPDSKAGDDRGKNKPHGSIKIDLASPFTAAFWIKSDTRTPGAPISFGSNYLDFIKVESRRDYALGGFRFRYSSDGACSSLSTGNINDGKPHWVALYQTGGKPGDEAGLYVDGKLVESCKLESSKRKKALFLINNFNGELQDIRIYDIALSKAQMAAVYNNNKVTLTSRLFADGEAFIPKYHLAY